MHVTPLEPVGARVTDLDLAAATADGTLLGAADLVPQLRALLAEHGVLVVPDQQLDDDGFLAFLHAFGELTFTTGETPLESHPELNVISNVGRTTPPRSSFHVDTSYVRHPPAYTALRAVEVPAEGGATQFSNQYRAAETLPAETRERIEGRLMRHVVTGVEPAEGEETEAEHPLLRPHPLTGREALFLTTLPRCAGISGLEPEESDTLTEELYAHSTRPDNVLAHAWAPGDVVIWDNAAVLHRADHSGVVGDRVMHRGMVLSHGLPG